MRLARVQTEAEPLEGLAKSGSEACLHALRECSHARALKGAALPRCEHGLAQGFGLGFTLAPGDAAAYQRVAAALIQRRRSAPPAQGLRDAAGSESPGGGSPIVGACMVSASCSTGGAAGAPVQAPATPAGAPDQAHTHPARPRRPAWLEEVAQRVSQGISLGSRASAVGPRLLAPAAPFQGLPPTVYGLGDGCAPGGGDQSPRSAQLVAAQAAPLRV